MSEWHPLEDHSADAAACLEALLENTLIRRRLATLGGLEDLSPEQIARLCVLAALHDAGKVNHGFQRKAGTSAGLKAGHVRPLFALLASSFREGDAVLSALGIDEILEWGPEGLFFAALAHHGQPLAADAHAAEADPALWKPLGPVDPVAGLRQLAASARTWFPAAGRRAEPLPDVPAFHHAFSGLVTLADWLASDTQFFPFTEEGESNRIAFSRERARQALAAMSLDASSARAQLALPAGWFEALFQFPPRPAQETILKLGVPARGSLVVLESETGSGKTEAAFARFLTLFHSGAVDGLYFALPTRTAATQIHDRIFRIVQRAFPDADARPPVILAVPGYLKVDDVEGTRDDPRLAPFQTLWFDDPVDRVRWRRWAAEGTKRYLAGAIVVGTIDQVLLSSLRVKHAHLRATALLRHLLVVDEVHASDAYMNRVLETVLERHLSAGGHALLMSATLGATARQRFLGLDAADTPLEAAERVPYPALTMREGRHCSVVDAAGKAREKRVRVELVPEIDDPVAIASRALAAARDGARVLVIRNTVADAIATQMALEAAGHGDWGLLFSCGDRAVAAPHHSRYSREDRQLLDAALERRFGPAAAMPCVVVATQTVQQSLDLDADLLVTDLCPMDVLLQRIGRLHRHARGHRPERFATARVTVLVPSKELWQYASPRTGEPRGPHGIGRVYRDLRILQATRVLLESEPELVIPAKNRHYVEATTHPAALEKVASSRSPEWAAHRNWLSGVLMAELGVATLNKATWDRPFGTEGWASDGGRIATRLGAADRVVVFDEPFVTAFGVSSSSLTMPAWMALGIPEEAEPANVTALDGGGVTFRFGEKEFRYDRLGLRQERKAENDSEEEDHG